MPGNIREVAWWHGGFWNCWCWVWVRAVRVRGSGCGAGWISWCAWGDMGTYWWRFGLATDAKRWQFVVYTCVYILWALSNNWCVSFVYVRSRNGVPVQMKEHK